MKKTWHRGKLNFLVLWYDKKVLPRINRILLRLLRKFNPIKDRNLSWQLYDIAEQYDPEFGRLCEKDLAMEVYQTTGWFGGVRYNGGIN